MRKGRTVADREIVDYSPVSPGPNAPATWNFLVVAAFSRPVRFEARRLLPLPTHGTARHKPAPDLRGGEPSLGPVARLGRLAAAAHVTGALCARR
jgi:hypothetical protein